MENLIHIGVPAFLAMVIALAVIPIVIKWVKRRGFLAFPNHRTSHSVPTPSMGGIGVFTGLLVVLPFLKFDLEITALLFCVILLFISGLWDDRYHMKSLVKLAIQLICSVFLYFVGFKIDNLHGILGLYEISEFWSVLISVFFIVGVTNAFNLIDGIDGLAVGISLINASFFGVMFYMNDQINYAMIAFCLSGALLGFLRYNFSPAKIFMGDSGSLFLGLLMSVFMIKTLQTNSVSELSVSVAIVLVFLPVFDTIRFFAYRVLKGGDPFVADRNHLHHIVLRLFPKHNHATLLILSIHFSLLGTIFFKDIFS